MGEVNMDELRKQDDFRNAVAVKLSDLVSEMEMQFDGFKSFLNLETGEVITVSIEELGVAEEGLTFFVRLSAEV